MAESRNWNFLSKDEIVHLMIGDQHYSVYETERKVVITEGDRPIFHIYKDGYSTTDLDVRVELYNCLKILGEVQ